MKLTKTTFFLGCVVGGMGAATVPFLFTNSQAEGAHLLPFQGRLTDAAGLAVPDGAKVVEFKMYDAPTGGTVKWVGEVHKLSVNGGLVNTMLGSKFPLGGVDFSTQTYLQITVDAQADGQAGNGIIDTADPPLLPRQSVVPAVYAMEALNSSRAEKLKAGDDSFHDWSAVFGSQNPSTGTIAASRVSFSEGSLPSTVIASTNGITGSQLADNSVGTGEIASNAVTSEKMADNSVGTGEIANNAVTSVKIFNGAVLGVDLDAGTLTDRELSPTSAAMGPHFFKAAAIKGLWSSQTGGSVREVNLSDTVPSNARGAILKVIVKNSTVTGFGGSVVFTDADGNFADTLSHYFNIGFTNYNEHYVGGTVFVPFHAGKKFKYKHRGNNAAEDAKVGSYGAVFGWY